MQGYQKNEEAPKGRRREKQGEAVALTGLVLSYLPNGERKCCRWFAIRSKALRQRLLMVMPGQSSVRKGEAGN